ncbi:MAG TPA: hypothetical protein VJC16_01020 [Candidatus Nanoarchaeia archaeon]|nr:hypothetical protein [Candidatus Nanoarchaeia archaeon]
MSKGTIEVQVHWIFIAVAGSLILLFFAGFAVTQQRAGEQRDLAGLQRSLQTIIAGVEAGSGSDTRLRAPGEITYSCEGFSIGLSEVGSAIAFAPAELSSAQGEIITASREWRLPFRVANFLYVTSPAYRYILVYRTAAEESMADTLFRALPDTDFIMKEKRGISEMSGILSQGRIRLVFFGSTPPVISLPGIADTPPEDISAVAISGNTIDGTGTVQFFTYGGGTFTSAGDPLPFLKQESVMGAVFAGDMGIYRCGMERALERLSLVAEMYGRRAAALQDEGRYQPPASNCRSVYDPDDFMQMKEKQLTVDGIAQVAAASSAVKNKNNQAQIFSCAPVY